MPRPQIIIIGAGPVGLYAAYVLAKAGWRVKIIDDGRRGAGWASGGMLGAAYEVLASGDAPHEFKVFARESQKEWSRLLGTEKAPVVAGSYFVARTKAEEGHLATLEANASHFDISLTTCMLPSGTIGTTALFCPTDIAFDPRQMLKILRQESARQGVTFIEGSVTQIDTGKVTLSDGSTLSADQIIVANGHGGNTLAKSVPELAHLSLVKGQMMAIAGSGVVTDHVIRAGRIYLIPRGDKIILGATSNPDDTNAEILDLPSHAELLHEAIALCPALARGQVVESWAGLRPMTPDGLPLVGLSQVEGVILACGTYRNGWLLAAGIANGIRALILDEPQSAANMQLFAPNRFSIAT